MAILSGKAASVLLAGSLAVTAVGVTFNGGQTIDNVKNQLIELKDKVVAYDAAEAKLLEKIGLIKADATGKLTNANGKIVDAKTMINDLEAEKSLLTTKNEKLTAERDALLSTKAQLEADLETANGEISQLKVGLAAANASIDDLNGQIQVLENQLSALQANYDALVEENEANKSEAERANEEVKKANDKVAELERAANEVEAGTDGKSAMTQEELDAISTENQPDVFDAELVVKNLNLTYIQDGQSQAFKDAHPDLDIQEGDRVWRITNNNEFKVYVEYTKGAESGELIANASQTFYLTETGGTMIIKWQDENGVWKQTVKAGA
ncbi:hypothetical protein [Metabacillus sp. 84]|uniref:hypothetical protein n=1 Tax=Metabacillus sp. 84 TaxID=3404705 RepID=UPI003CEAC83E